MSEIWRFTVADKNGNQFIVHGRGSDEADAREAVESYLAGKRVPRYRGPFRIVEGILAGDEQ